MKIFILISINIILAGFISCSHPLGETYEDRCPDNIQIKNAIDKLAGKQQIVSYTINGHDAMDTIKKHSLNNYWIFPLYDDERTSNPAYGKPNEPCFYPNYFSIYLDTLTSSEDTCSKNCKLRYLGIIGFNSSRDSLGMVLIENDHNLNIYPFTCDNATPCSNNWSITTSGTNTILQRSIYNYNLILIFSRK